MQLPSRWLSPTPSSPDSRPRLLTRGAVSPEGAGRRRNSGTWLLSRALYRCKHVPLGHVDAADRRAVLRNLLLAWAPFDRTEYGIALQGDTALVSAWDGVAVRALLVAGGAPESATVWPESALREPKPGDGLRVLHCLEGVEAQAWHRGALVASRWWPEPPDLAEAQIWLRSLGPLADGIDSLPAAVPAAWRRRPWHELQGIDDLLSTSSRLERIAVGTALVGFAAMTAAQAHQAWAAYEERASMQRELERSRLDAAPVLAARDRAESMARELQGLAQQLTGVLPLELLQYLSDILPPRGVTLKELELAGRKLRLSFELGTEVQRSALVKDLQTGGWLTNVVEARDTGSRGWVPFEAELAGTRAPILPARSEASTATPAARQSQPTTGSATPAPSFPLPAALPPAQPQPARRPGPSP